MSLPAFDTQGSLFGSLPAIAGELFSEDDRYKLFARKIWPVLAKARPELEKCYCATNGRRATEPVLLLGVSIFQFLERVPDRQAAELAKYHLGWKLALNLELGQGSFHHTSLSYFRERLVEHEQAQVAFAAVLEALQEEGLVPRKGKQRLDSTHLLGLVSRMSKLECMRETLRLALEELAGALPEGERAVFWPALWERYVESKLDYKSSEGVLRAKQVQVGEDSLRLLRWLEPLAVEVREGRQARLLKEVFHQQYLVVEGGTVEPIKVHAPGAVQNPHDPEAQWSAKGRGEAKKEWVGYKVQVAESFAAAAPPAEGAAVAGSEEEGEPEPSRSFITSILTQGAIESDEAGLAASLEAQRGCGLEVPGELYVDGAYVSAAALAEAAAEKRELLGPARASAGRENLDPAFRIEAFDVEIAQRRAICPAGHANTQCSRLEEKTSGKVSYRFEFSTHCHGCLLREKCVAEGQKHRTIVVGEHHDRLQARRREQETPEFAQRMRQRNAIEGTQSELVRAHGLRRARYRGRAKVNLQNQLIGAACNIKRWLRLLAWEVREAAAKTAGCGIPQPA